MGGETFWSLSVDLLSVLQRPCLSLQDPLLALCPRVAESENSFEVVSSAGDSVASGRSRVLESRDQIASTFATCPASWLSRASCLSGQSRIRRLGKLASGRVLSWIKEPFLPTDLSLWIYAACSSWCFVVRAWIVLWCFTSGRGANSISHSFPSEWEARVYLDSASAGFSEPYVFRD